MSFKFRKAGTKSSGKGHSPSEPCGMEVASNSVITLGIPFQTPRAKEIRECLHAKVINQDGQRTWIYRNETEEWTNIDLKSTADEPTLTAPPVYAVEKTLDVLTHCPAVSKVSIVDEYGAPLTMAQARARPAFCAALHALPLGQQLGLAFAGEGHAV